MTATEPPFSLTLYVGLAKEKLPALVGAPIGKDHALGLVGRVGWKGACAGTELKMLLTLLVGLLTTFSMAVTVSVGATPAGGVAAVKIVPHALPSPATPPDELTHDAIASASVLISVLDA